MKSFNDPVLTSFINFRTIGCQLNLHYRSFLLFLILLLYIPQHIHSYCWQAPAFEEAPKIQQLTLAKVRVSWEGIVENKECADQFLVKYWKTSGFMLTQSGREKGWTQGYKLTPAIDNTGYKLTEEIDKMANYTDIEVSQRTLYMFQAIARVDKGLILGVTYNKSPPVKFRTSDIGAKGGTIITGISNQIFVLIAISSLFGVVIVMGLIYKVSGYKYQMPSIIEDEDDDDDENDLIDGKKPVDDILDLNTDEPVRHRRAGELKVRIGDITDNPGSRRGSVRSSITETPVTP